MKEVIIKQPDGIFNAKAKTIVSKKNGAIWNEHNGGEYHLVKAQPRTWVCGPPREHADFPAWFRKKQLQFNSEIVIYGAHDLNRLSLKSNESFISLG